MEKKSEITIEQAKLKEKKKQQKRREELTREKERYYGYYDDVKTFARDNGEW